MRFAFISILALLATAVFFSYRLFSPIDIKEGDVIVRVMPGNTKHRIASELSKKGLLRGEIDFSILSFLSDRKNIKEGTYYITRGMSEYDMYRSLLAGPAVREKTITIIEGWTVAKISEYFSKEGFGTAEDFLEETKKDWSASYSFLSRTPPLSSLEGFLFPDTYRVFEDSSSRDIITKMLSNFDKKFSDQMKRDARVRGFTILEVTTLASIIEREVATSQDRALVSDIFSRRLKKNMALQADSTVNYATGKSAPQASLSDIAIDSAYNTYKYRGLPPGPIGNPGLTSLKAALYPNANPYLYFLTSPDGRVHYSETFEDHKKKKQRYL